MVDSEDRYSTEKASSVQSAILYDCDAEALSNSIRPSQVSSEPRVQISRSSARYSAGSPKNCPEARGGSVRVQISLSRPVNFFMVKPRLCPRQDQSIPVQSRRPLGCGQVFSDQPAASRLEHCELGDRILPIERRNTKSPGPRFPLLEARSWQEAKSNLVTVALGKDDRIASCWTLGPPV
ncbi:hypothetical protein YC2023_108344 [Brassica napus]